MTEMPAQFDSPDQWPAEKPKPLVQQLTIVGEHQHGRSHLLLQAALTDAKAGRSVLYECQRHVEVTTRMHDLRALADPRDVAKVNLGCGEESMLFMGGGQVRFSAYERGIPRYAGVQTHLFDGVEVRIDPFVDAKVDRVIRTVLA